MRREKGAVQTLTSSRFDMFNNLQASDTVLVAVLSLLGLRMHSVEQVHILAAALDLFSLPHRL